MEGLAFEWTIEALDGGTCIVRLVSSGFGHSEEWDAQYDGMSEGWQLFLLNLRLHMEHFRGRTATAMLPTGMWGGTRDEVWGALTEALGIPSAPAVGERVEVTAPDAPDLAGTVADAAPHRVALLLDRPAAGHRLRGSREDTALQSPRRSGATCTETTRRLSRSETTPRWREWLSQHRPQGVP